MNHVTHFFQRLRVRKTQAYVFGKGASLDPGKVADALASDSLIVSINDAMNKLNRTHIVIMNDLNVIERLDPQKLQNVEAFFMPASIPRRDRHNPEIRMYQTPNFWMRNHGRLGNIWGKDFYFDANFGEIDFFEGSPIYCAYHSTYETVMHIMGSHGIRKIYTSGIDYNSDYHSDFRKEHQADFSAMRPHVEQIKRTHGIEEIRT